MKLAARGLVVVCCLAASSAAAQTPDTLVAAAKRDDPAVVRALLTRTPDVNAQGADGFTALHWAAQRNNSELVDRLLKAGARATVASRYKVTPLYLAAQNGNARM